MDVTRSMKATLVALGLLWVVTWLPHVYSCVRAFFLESLPSIVSAIVAPKCLFVFSNIIVVFLISESKFSQSNHSLNTDDDDGMLHDRKEEDVVAVTEALLPAISVESKEEQESSMAMVVHEEKESSIVNEGVQMDQCEEAEVYHLVLQEVHDVQGEVEEEEGLELVLRDEVEEDCAAEELERYLPPADELNRRVEDFIARFNMERQLEARMLVSCC